MSAIKSKPKFEIDEMDELLKLYLECRAGVTTSDNVEETPEDKENRLQTEARKATHIHYVRFKLGRRSPEGDVRAALRKVEELALSLYRNPWKKELYSIKKHGAFIMNYLRPALSNYRQLLEVLGYEQHGEKYVLDIDSEIKKEGLRLTVIKYLEEMFRDKVSKVALDLYTLQLQQPASHPTIFSVPAKSEGHSPQHGGDRNINTTYSSSGNDMTEGDLYGRDEHEFGGSGGEASGVSKTMNNIRNVNVDMKPINVIENILDRKSEQGVEKTRFNKDSNNGISDSMRERTRLREQERWKEPDRLRKDEKWKEEERLNTRLNKNVNNEISGYMKEQPTLKEEERWKAEELSKVEKRLKEEGWKERLREDERLKEQEILTGQDILREQQRKGTIVHSTGASSVSRNKDVNNSDPKKTYTTVLSIEYRKIEQEGRDNHQPNKEPDLYGSENVAPKQQHKTTTMHDFSVNRVPKQDSIGDNKMTLEKVMPTGKAVNEFVKSIVEKSSLENSSKAPPIEQPVAVKLNNQSSKITNIAGFQLNRQVSETSSNDAALKSSTTLNKLGPHQSKQPTTVRQKVFGSSLGEETGVVSPIARTTSEASSQPKHINQEHNRDHGMTTRSQGVTSGNISGRTEFKSYQTSTPIDSKNENICIRTGDHTESKSRVKKSCDTNPNICQHCRKDGDQYNCMRCANMIVLCQKCVDKQPIKCSKGGPHKLKNFFCEETPV